MYPISSEPLSIPRMEREPPLLNNEKEWEETTNSKHVLYPQDKERTLPKERKQPKQEC
jgi:hypothetical protein